MTKSCVAEPRPEVVNVLLVEDNPDDADLLREAFVEAGATEFALTHVERLEDAQRSLSQCRFDVILLDLSLPDSEGLDTVAKMHDAASGTPIVVTTGLDDEALALEAVHAGAQEYLVKGQTDGRLLARAVRHGIERQRLLCELQDALGRIKTLRGLIPICASCKKVRDDQGYWSSVEAYVEERSEADFTHSLCPQCAKRLYPDLVE